MNAWYEEEGMGLSRALSEDVGAPELRNPNHSASRGGRSWLSRMMMRVFG